MLKSNWSLFLLYAYVCCFFVCLAYKFFDMIGFWAFPAIQYSVAIVYLWQFVRIMLKAHSKTQEPLWPFLGMVFGSIVAVLAIA